MSNTAEIYKFPTRQGIQESSMAELEKGYLRLPPHRFPTTRRLSSWRMAARLSG